MIPPHQCKPTQMRSLDDTLNCHRPSRSLNILQRCTVVITYMGCQIDSDAAFVFAALPKMRESDIRMQVGVLAEFQRDRWVVTPYYLMIDDVDTVSEYDRCEFAGVVKTIRTAVTMARSGWGSGGGCTEGLGPLMYHEAECEKKEDVSIGEMIHQA